MQRLTADEWEKALKKQLFDVVKVASNPDARSTPTKHTPPR